MDQREYLEILKRAGMLKIQPRHNWTEGERRESVADHTFRMALMAMLLEGVEEFRDVDISRVIRMCLIHDLGEAFTGDIPTFEKTEADACLEDEIFDKWVDGFSEPQKSEWKALLTEMNALETTEAKTYKALDKLEAILSHDEADIATWLPLEKDLQLTYAVQQTAFSPYLTGVRRLIDEWTQEKIRQQEE